MKKALRSSALWKEMKNARLNIPFASGSEWSKCRLSKIKKLRFLKLGL